MVNVHLRSRQYAFPLAHRHLSPPSFPIQSECSRLVSRTVSRIRRHAFSIMKRTEEYLRE